MKHLLFGSLVLSALLLGAAVSLRTAAEAQAPKTKNPAEKPAEKPPAKPAPSADEQAILKAGESYVAAFAKQDAKTISELFAEDAEVLDVSGRPLVGRAAIHAAIEASLKGAKGARIVLATDSLRVQKSGLAIEHGTSTELREGAPPVVIEYSTTWIKEGGAWKIAALRESLPAPSVTSFDILESELGWLVGSWTSAGGKTRTDFSWAAGGQFLMGSFALEDGRSGFEIIGWDPSARRIRSWAFSADGSFGEGVWTRDKNRWSVATLAVLPNGDRAEITNLFTRIDDTTVELKGVNRTVNGAVAPGLPAVKLLRAKN